MMYLICIKHGLGCIVPEALVNTNQMHHSYTCCNYNLREVHMNALIRWSNFARFHYLKGTPLGQKSLELVGMALALKYALE